MCRAMSSRKRARIRRATAGTTAQAKRNPTNARGRLAVRMCCSEHKSGRSRGTGRITITTTTPGTQTPADKKGARTGLIIRDRLRVRIWDLKSPPPIWSRAFSLAQDQHSRVEEVKIPTLPRNAREGWGTLGVHDQFVIPIWVRMKA